MCLSRNDPKLFSTSGDVTENRNYRNSRVTFDIASDERYAENIQDNNNDPLKAYDLSAKLPEDERKLRSRLHTDLSLAFKLKDLRKSSSFSGFSRIARSLSFSGEDVISPQEIEDQLDENKEPSKLTKAQIKEYAEKYKNFKAEILKENHPRYRELFEHTQPAHLITMVSFLYLAFRLFPDSRRSAAEASTLTRLFYVSSVSAVFGFQLWMTFVSGLALFFTVPRHVFAQVQSILFPLYFLINAGLMMIAIITYTQHHPTHMWNTHQLIQGIMLVTCFLVNLGIRLYLAPLLTKLITIKVAIEKEAGLGSEIGSNQPGVLANCPHYMKLHRSFRKVHLIIACGNMLSIAAMSLHMYYLATKLCSVDL